MMSDKTYIVKSSNQIIGPYTKSEIIDEIKSRNISLIDEIKTSHSRWKFVREHKEFFDIVRTVRTELEQVVEETGTLTQTMATATITLTDSAPSNQIQIPATAIAAEAAPIQNLKRKVIKPADNRFYILAMVIVAIFITAGFFIIKSKKQIKNAILMPNIKSQVLVLGQLQLYNEAYALMQKNTQGLASAATDDQKILFSSIMIQYSNQSYEARQVLEKVLTTATLSAAESASVYNVIGLSYIKELDYLNARTSFEKALSYSSKNFAAQYNLGATDFLESNYSKAAHYFDEIYKQNSDPRIGLSLLMAAIEKNRLEGGQFLANGDTYLSEIVDYDWQIEKDVLSYYISSRNHSAAETQSYLNSLLSRNFEFYLEKTNSINFQKDILGAKSFLKLGAEIYGKSRADFESHVFYAATLIMNESYSEASQILSAASKIQPNHPYVNYLNAIIYKRTGQIEQSLSLVKVLSESNSNENLTHLLASLCFEKMDFVCAEKNWNQIIIRNPRSLEALAGLGWTTLKKGDRSASLNYLKRGMTISEHYSPLLKLKYELEK